MALAATLTAASASVTALAQSGPERHSVDVVDLREMAAQSQEAIQLFEEGEARLRQADLKAAEAAFRRVRELAPASGLAARRHAQTLAELGRKAEAVAACREATVKGRSTLDARACVSALMSGTDPVSVDDMNYALRMAHWAQKLEGQPFGDAAMCEIAHRIGDDGMLKQCQAALLRSAPNHYETRRWTAVTARRSTWPIWLGWGFVLGSGVLTLVHALWRRARRAGRTVVPAASAAALLCFASLPARAQGEAPSAAAPAASLEVVPHDKLPTDPKEREKVRWQLSKEFPIDPNDPSANIPSLEARNKSPLEFGYYLQDLASEASYAEKRQEFGVAAKYWAALGKAVPDVSIGFKRACRAYEKAGDLDKARENCAAVLQLPDPQAEDFGQLANLVLAKPKLEAVDITDLEEMVKHLRDSKGGQPAAGIAGAHISCQLGVRLEDLKRLDECTKILSKAAPQDPKTLTFSWSRAMLRRDYGEARRVLAELKKGPMEPSAIRKLEAATQEASAWWRLPLTDWRIGLAMLLLVAVAAAAVIVGRRRGGGAVQRTAAPTLAAHPQAAVAGAEPEAGAAPPAS